MSDKQQLLLVDGSGYIFRAFHALPPMTRGDGTPVNAVYGFTAMLMKLIDDMQPDHVAVVFDVARKTFRSDIFPDYKANRSEPPEDLVPHLHWCARRQPHWLCRRLNWPGLKLMI